MFGSLKQQLLIKRAQAAYFLADTTLESGDLRTASNMYRTQAQTLSHAGADPALALRGWLGVLRCVERLLIHQNVLLSDPLRDALHALSNTSRTQLPERWDRYDGFRDFVVALVKHNPVWARVLCDTLASLFHHDPRVHYAYGRACMAILDRRLCAEHEAQECAKDALQSFQNALSAAYEMRCQDRWKTPLHIRMAAILWRTIRSSDSEAASRAWELVRVLDLRQEHGLPNAYRLTIAQIRLHMDRSMGRLRALDTLKELSLSDDISIHRCVMSTLEEYLEGLDWTYYATEQDRVRSIVVQCAPVLGVQSVRRVTLYLDLLDSLRSASQLDTQTDPIDLLTMLRDLEADRRGHTAASAFYTIAIHLAQPSSQPFNERLSSALQAHASTHINTLESSLNREPLALAIAALQLIDTPTLRTARALLNASLQPAYSVPHVQATLTLAIPTLLAHWNDWIELQITLRDALSSYLRLAPQPSYGFASIAKALIALNEPKLAEEATARALACEETENPKALAALKIQLARLALERAQPQHAVRWLLDVS